MQICLFLIGGFAVLQKSLSVGQFTVVSTYFSMLLSSARYFLGLGKSIQENRVAYTRTREIQKIPEQTNGQEMLDQIRAIRMENVAFSYGERWVFQDYNLELHAGKMYGISGINGSGKTTLGEYLEQVFDCNLFRMDDFFLRMEQRTPQRLKETGGNVDYERFEETVLRPIFQKQTVFYQPFSCRKWNLLEGYPVPYKKLNIIEGSYSMHPYFKNPYQLRVFLNISPKDQMENIKKRNGPEKAKQFQNMWIPKEEAYFKKFHVMDGAIQVMWNLKTEK